MTTIWQNCFYHTSLSYPLPPHPCFLIPSFLLRRIHPFLPFPPSNHFEHLLHLDNPGLHGVEGGCGDSSAFTNQIFPHFLSILLKSWPYSGRRFFRRSHFHWAAFEFRGPTLGPVGMICTVPPHLSALSYSSPSLMFNPLISPPPRIHPSFPPSNHIEHLLHLDDPGLHGVVGGGVGTVQPLLIKFFHTFCPFYWKIWPYSGCRFLIFIGPLLSFAAQLWAQLARYVQFFRTSQCSPIPPHSCCLIPKRDYTVRGQSNVWRLTEYWSPTSSPLGECVPPAFGAGEVTLAGWRGGGGSIFGRRQTLLCTLHK